MQPSRGNEVFSCDVRMAVQSAKVANIAPLIVITSAVCNRYRMGPQVHYHVGLHILLGPESSTMFYLEVSVGEVGLQYFKEGVR